MDSSSSSDAGRFKHRSAPFMPYVLTLFSVFIVTIIGKGMQPTFDLIDIVLLYLLPVLVSAVRWGLWPSLTASFFGILAFDYFFVPPVLSFTVGDVHHLLSFVIYLIVALVTGTLAAKLRREAALSRERERRTAALHGLSEKMAGETDIRQVLRTVATSVAQSTKTDAAVFLPDPENNLLEPAAYSWKENISPTEKERDMAQWVYDLKEELEDKTQGSDGGHHLFVPVQDKDTVLAVLMLRLTSQKELSREERKDLEALTNMTALAITRTRLAEEAGHAKVLAESDKLHRALLNAVSHDLRTPLASITGAATELLSAGMLHNEQTRSDLLETINNGALRMNRFVTKLLDMARLESGILKPKKDWCDILDIVGVALKELEDILPEGRLKTYFPDQIPLVAADFALIEQVLINLLENAVKYSPADSTISIRIEIAETDMVVTVEDQGPSIPENERLRVFDKFYRLASSKHVGGTGLGLSICAGIVEAHGGTIRAEGGVQGGNRFIFTLPLGASPPPGIPMERENTYVK